MAEILKSNIAKFALWTLLFVMLSAIIYLLFQLRGDRLGKNISSSDTLFISGPATINNYTYTLPTVSHEHTITFDERNPGLVLSRNDSDAIVMDYLKERFYTDSSFYYSKTDTAKMIYRATVAKNALTHIDFTHEFKPRIAVVTNNRYRNSLFIGGGLGWLNNKPKAVISAGFETKKYDFGGLWDPLTDPKGGYVFVRRRINFK